jgi:hypothetical protein
MDSRRYEEEGAGLIGSHIAELRGLTFDRAEALPEVRGEDMLVAGRKCMLTTFRQRLQSGEVLVTVELARRTFLGLGSVNRERGIVFRRDGLVRDASSEELLVSGG